MVDKIGKSGGEISPISKERSIKNLKPTKETTLLDMQPDQIVSGTTLPRENIRRDASQSLLNNAKQVPDSVEDYIIAHGVNPNKKFTDLGLNSPNLIDTEGFNTI